MPRFDIYKNPNPKASHAYYLDIQSDLVTTATRWCIPLRTAKPGQPIVNRAQGLVNVMRDGGTYGKDDIPWFNGGLFKKVKVPLLNVLDVTELRNAAALNWSAIDVSFFGTLFERGLDPAKRSQLGAHYTDPATIMRIIEPVLQRPLLQIWEQIAQKTLAVMAKSKKKNDANYKVAKARFIDWLDQLKNYRVLDPACGSGNFLFWGLKALKDIEHKSHLDAAAMGLDREADLVTGPHNMLGIELNEYAAELTRVPPLMVGTTTPLTCQTKTSSNACWR